MLELLVGVIQLLEVAILIRVLWSYVDRSPYVDSAPKRLLWMLTEPLLAPVRNLIGPVGMFDLSPMVVIIVLQLIDQALRKSIY